MEEWEGEGGGHLVLRHHPRLKDGKQQRRGHAREQAPRHEDGVRVEELEEG